MTPTTDTSAPAADASVQDTVQIATVVSVPVADTLRSLSRAGERSVAAELRLAINAWISQEDNRKLLDAAA